jgi:hypothetical protein
MTARVRTRRAKTFGMLVVMLALVLTATAVAVAASPAAAVGPHNDFLAVQVGGDCIFNIGAAPAPDGSATATSWDISYAWPSSPWSSYTTVRVDGSDYIYGSSSGTLVKAPTDDSATSNVSQWQVGDILVTQRLSLTGNSATGRQDVAQIEYSVQNLGAASHDVGVRLMIDTEINGTDDALFRVPGVGALTAERDFTGGDVPTGVYVFATLSDTTHIAFVSSGYAGAVPDRMVFAYWPNIYHATDLWNYTVDPATTFGDSAYALYWNPTTLAPGASRAYASSYGLGSSSADLRPPLALGVYGPNSLNAVRDAYSPDPFNVNAWVQDIGTGDASNVQAKITLPPELRLVSGSATISLAGLAVNEEKQATWKVHAIPQGTAKTVSYKVTAWADGVPAKTVTRSLALPAVTAPKLTLKLSGLRRGVLSLGKSVTAKGVVTPSRYVGAALTLTVQKKKGARWITVKTKTLTINALAKYSWRYKPKKLGAYRELAALTSGDATSPWRTFKVK